MQGKISNRNVEYYILHFRLLAKQIAPVEKITLINPLINIYQNDAVLTRLSV